MRSRFMVSVFPIFAIDGLSVQAISIDLSSTASIKAAAATLAADMAVYYTGNSIGGTPGLLPPPYYWWESGAMFGSLVDYWYYTGDSTYNDLTTQALLFQVGPSQDYMTPNQTKTEGNDDQAFWGMAAMSAAEVNFPNPPLNKPQWVALAQAVFDTQVARWDESSCGGGLRWQIFSFNNGYNYKNSISNGCFFNLASRLARYTGNATYAEWAEKVYDWMWSVRLIDEDYYIYDGFDLKLNCTRVNRLQWTYNAGAVLLGAANMFSYTNGSTKWEERVVGHLKGIDVFFTRENIMLEVACENNGRCDVDMHSFKAYLARWLAATTKLVPFTYNAIMAKLAPSARAAVAQCSGGDNRRTCGLKWTTNGVWDGSWGLGQQMAALEVVQSNLISQVSGPLTNLSGGTSLGKNAAGGKASTGSTFLHPNTTTDVVVASMLTAIILLSIGGMFCFMVIPLVYMGAIGIWAGDWRMGVSTNIGALSIGGFTQVLAMSCEFFLGTKGSSKSLL